MANVPTAEVLSTWSDEAGQTRRFSFHVEVAGGTSAPNLTTITAAAQPVIAAIEAVSDCKFLGAVLVLPINPTTSGAKGSADSDSRARRHAKTLWRGAADENAITEIVEIGIPDPKDTMVDTTLPQPAIKTTGTEYEALVTGVTTNAKTRGGEAVASFKGSIIEQKPITMNSRQ